MKEKTPRHRLGSGMLLLVSECRLLSCDTECVLDNLFHALVERKIYTSSLTQFSKDYIESVEVSMTTDRDAYFHLSTQLWKPTQNLEKAGELPNLTASVHGIGLWSWMGILAAFQTKPENNAPRNLNIKPGLLQVVTLPHQLPVF